MASTTVAPAKPKKLNGKYVLWTAMGLMALSVLIFTDIPIFFHPGPERAHLHADGLLFILHATAGLTAFFAGPFNFSTRLRQRKLLLERAAGLGVLVEAVPDIQLAVAPVDQVQATALLRSLRGAALFDGLRGAPALDLGPAAAVIASVSHLLTDVPGIAELDLNPVLASANGCVAVDWRILAG